MKISEMEQEIDYKTIFKKWYFSCLFLGPNYREGGHCSRFSVGSRFLELVILWQIFEGDTVADFRGEGVTL